MSRSSGIRRFAVPALPLFVLILTAGVFVQELPAQGLEAVRLRGYLNLAVLEEPAPLWSVQTDGRWEGFGIRRGRDLAETIGVDLRVLPFQTADAAFAALTRGEADIFLPMRFRTLSDSSRSFLTLPIARLNMVLVVNRLAFAELKIPPDTYNRFLEGRFNVAVPNEESLLAGYSREFPHLPPPIPSPAENLWRDVESGRIVGIYIDEARAKDYFSTRPQAGLNLRYIQLDIKQSISGLVSWKEDLILEWLNIAVDAWAVPENLKDIASIIQGENHE